MRSRCSPRTRSNFQNSLQNSTLNPLAAVVGMMLPAGLSQQADVLYSLNPSPFVVGEQSYGSTQKRLLELLGNRGPLRGRQIDRHFAQVDWRKSAQPLVKIGRGEDPVCAASTESPPQTYPHCPTRGAASSG